MDVHGKQKRKMPCVATIVSTVTHGEGYWTILQKAEYQIQQNDQIQQYSAYKDTLYT